MPNVLFRMCGKKKHYTTIQSAEQARLDSLKHKGIKLQVSECRCGKFYLDYEVYKTDMVHTCKMQRKKTEPKRIRRKKERNCRDKYHFDSYDKAVKTMIYLSRKYNRRLKVYRCSVCGKHAVARVYDKSGQFVFNEVK